MINSLDKPLANIKLRFNQPNEFKSDIDALWLALRFSGSNSNQLKLSTMSTGCSCCFPV